MRKNLLIASGVLELGTGLALISLPSMLAELLLGVPLKSPAASLIARIAGAALIALGLICLLAKGDMPSGAATAEVAGMTFYNAAVAGLLVYAALGLGVSGIALWPAVMLHAALLAWCLANLRKN